MLIYLRLPTSRTVHVARWTSTPPSERPVDQERSREAADLGVAIAALYPEAGKPDDSDIMPGSEFDGPVVL